MSKPRLIPAEGCMIVRRVESKTKKKSLIELPESAKEKPTQGEVVFSNSLKFDKTPGTIVLFGKYAGLELKFNDEDLVRLDDKEVFAQVIE